MTNPTDTFTLDPEGRERLETVVVPRPRCPQCQSPRLCAKGGTKQGGDGSITRYTRCKGCGHGFKLVLE